MTVASQRIKSDLTEANNKASGWRVVEDEAIMIVQYLLKDPRFVLTTYAVNILPDTAPVTFTSVGGRSVKKVRDRYEFLTQSGKYAESIKARIGAKVKAARDIIYDQSGSEDASGMGDSNMAKESPERDIGRLHRIMAALDYLGGGIKHRCWHRGAGERKKLQRFLMPMLMLMIYRLTPTLCLLQHRHTHDTRPKLLELLQTGLLVQS